MTPLGALADGTVSGFLAAALMTSFEACFWRTMGIGGVVEWQVNLVMVSQLLHEKYNPEKRLREALGMHLVHGALFGALLGGIFSASSKLSASDYILAAVALSLFLWLLVPFLFRKSFEGRTGARFSRAGIGISLASHLVYGLALGVCLTALMG